MENLSLNISSSSPSNLGPKDDKNEDFELSFGLSLGDQLGVDRNSNILMRSSSVATYLPVARDDIAGSQAPPQLVSSPCIGGLVRTSSLPMESDEEWRNRKEMQSLRRMEAKRRRSEKLKNLKNEKSAGGSGSSSLEEVEVGLRGKLEREMAFPVETRLPSRGLTRVRSQSSLAIWAATAKGKENCLGIRGSFESIDLERKAAQGSSGELNNIQSIPEGCNKETGFSAVKSVRSDQEGSSTTPKNGGGSKIGISVLEDMPCLIRSTNGQRVDGILCKYEKDGEV